MPRIVTVISVLAAVLSALLSYTDYLSAFWAGVIIVGAAFTGALSKSIAAATDHYLWTILGIVGGAVGIGGTALQQFNAKWGVICLAIGAALIAAGKELTPRVAALPMLILLLSVMQACGAEQIENTVTKTVVAVRAARKVTTVQHNYGHLQDAGYRQRLQGFERMYNNIDALGDTLAQFGTVTPGNKQAVLTQINEVALTLGYLISTGDLGVVNTQSQDEYRRWLLVASASINAIKVSIAAVDKPTSVARLRVLKIRE